ncbi:MAG: hypothetical protein ACLR8Y_01740 [Alistipes indistinctus]
MHDKPIQTCRAHSRTAVGCLSLFPRFSNRYPNYRPARHSGIRRCRQQPPPGNRPAAGVDPLYSRTAPAPAPDTLPGSPWLYADTELVPWRLHLMRQRVKEARLRVRYPGNYYEPSNRAYFRIPASVDAHYPRWVSLNAYGNVRVMMDGQTIYTGAASTSRTNSSSPHWEP